MTIDKTRLFEIKKKEPVFVIGCQRSGTSFLYRSLSKTLNIGFGRDNMLFMKFKNKIDKYKDLNRKENLKKLLADIEKTPVFHKRFKGLQINSDDFISCLEKRNYQDIVRTIYAYWSLKQGKLRWGGKTPDYTGYQKHLTQLFPDIKIISIIRDGRDVALSFLKLGWGPKDAYTAAKYWKKRIEKGSSEKQLLGDIRLEIKYENLLKFPEETFQNIISFLDYDDFDYDHIISKFREVVVPNIIPENIFKWKKRMSPKDIRVFEIEAGDQLKRYGYEILHKNYDELSLSYIEKGYHYLKDVVAKVKKGHVPRYFSKAGFQYKYR